MGITNKLKIFHDLGRGGKEYKHRANGLKCDSENAAHHVTKENTLTERTHYCTEVEPT